MIQKFIVMVFTCGYDGAIMFKTYREITSFYSKESSLENLKEITNFFLYEGRKIYEDEVFRQLGIKKFPRFCDSYLFHHAFPKNFNEKNSMAFNESYYLCNIMIFIKIMHSICEDVMKAFEETELDEIFIKNYYKKNK